MVVICRSIATCRLVHTVMIMVNAGILTIVIVPKRRISRIMVMAKLRVPVIVQMISRCEVCCFTATVYHVTFAIQAGEVTFCRTIYMIFGAQLV